jgi:hypothetical protein
MFCCSQKGKRGSAGPDSSRINQNLSASSESNTAGSKNNAQHGNNVLPQSNPAPASAPTPTPAPAPAPTLALGTASNPASTATATTTSTVKKPEKVFARQASVAVDKARQIGLGVSLSLLRKVVKDLEELAPVDRPLEVRSLDLIWRFLSLFFLMCYERQFGESHQLHNPPPNFFLHSHNFLIKIFHGRLKIGTQKRRNW